MRLGWRTRMRLGWRTRMRLGWRTRNEAGMKDQNEAGMKDQEWGWDDGMGMRLGWRPENEAIEVWKWGCDDGMGMRLGRRPWNEIWLYGCTQSLTNEGDTITDQRGRPHQRLGQQCYLSCRHRYQHHHDQTVISPKFQYWRHWQVHSWGELKVQVKNKAVNHFFIFQGDLKVFNKKVLHLTIQDSMRKPCRYRS